MSSKKNTRLLITIPQDILDRLNDASGKTNLSKSKLIQLCVTRGLSTVEDQFVIERVD